jgi:primary-amine oxidase
LLETARDARRSQEPSTGRYWKIINPGHLNQCQRPVAYRILPGHHTHPLHLQSSFQYSRAGFTRHHLWATPFADDEIFAAGKFPYQSDGRNDGLPVYSERWQSQTLVDADHLVTWHVLGCTHIVRPS